MKLKQQVISLLIAKRLRELGVKQDSLYAWDLYHEGKNILRVREKDEHIWDGPNIYSAFTVAELGEICRKMKDFDEPFPHLGADGWYYYTGEHSVPKKCKTEADARGKMLVYLLENKLITL